MDRRASDLMEAMVDIWVYYHYEEDGSRTLQIRGTEEVAAGVRTPQQVLETSISELRRLVAPEFASAIADGGNREAAERALTLVDLPAITEGRASNVNLRPGDVITVPERYF